MARLCPLVDHLLTQLTDCTAVIDCGSGQGHLSRLLSLCFGRKVVSIEANQQNVSGADHKDSNVLKCLSRYNLTDNIHSNCPKKINVMLDKSCSIGPIGLLTESDDQHLLLGLHACGPLSTTMVEQLTACGRTKAMALITCCYMKSHTKRYFATCFTWPLTSQINSVVRLLISFPMSSSLKALMPCGLSYAAKEVACHAIEKFADKLITKGNVKMSLRRFIIH